MHVKYFVKGLTFLCAILSSDGLKCSETCNTTTLNAQLGSEVSLPCSLLKSKGTNEARWSQNTTLLSIHPEGRVTFQDPRGGRVMAFPYLFLRGNFSILIRALQYSDLGTYCCELSDECWKIRLAVVAPQDPIKGPAALWFFVGSGVGVFIILLVIVCVLCFVCRGKCVRKPANSYDVPSSHREDRENCEKVHESPELEEHDGDYVEPDTEEDDYVNTRNDEDDGCQDNDREPSEWTGHHITPTIYENEEHSANVTRGVNVRPRPSPTGCREPPSQPSNLRAPYYANQSEIKKAAGRGKRRKKRKYLCILNMCSLCFLLVYCYNCH
ncbi:uncharacterized protein LOC143477662 isoform X2 [Brachyhypopomus gauderio]|uniref:uncharacterized protein LOC143477662 isoform X2 n=1 Tax=Brachyhypopomus gauderio TaxID=698409 RepID=UPI004042ED6D